MKTMERKLFPYLMLLPMVIIYKMGWCKSAGVCRIEELCEIGGRYNILAGILKNHVVYCNFCTRNLHICNGAGIAADQKD